MGYTREAPTNSDARISGRDVLDRIEELEQQRDQAAEDREEIEKQAAEVARLETVADEPSMVEDAREVLARLEDHSTEPLTEEEEKELRDLKSFAAEFNEDRDADLIREGKPFRDYAERLWAECGSDDMMEAAGNWPLNCIDWERAAAELQQDYTGADFDGVTYYFQ